MKDGSSNNNKKERPFLMTTENNNQLQDALKKNFSHLTVKRTQRKSRESTLVGFGSLVVANMVEVHFTIRRRKNGEGLCVNWPSHKASTGKWYSDVRFQERELKDALEDQILDLMESTPEVTEEGGEE